MLVISEGQNNCFHWSNLFSRQVEGTPTAESVSIGSLWVGQIKVTGYSLLINYSWAILIHYFPKSEYCMEQSFMVLCMMDKYYNQLKF